MQVIPVAGHDSMLLNLCGRARALLHPQPRVARGRLGPYGHRRGAGRRGHPRALERSSRSGRRQRASAATTARSTPSAMRSRGKQPRGQQHQVTSAAEAAVLEAAARDQPAPGQRAHGGRGGAPRSPGPASRAFRCASSSAAGSSATRCRMLAYLFYIGDRARTDLPYLAGRRRRRAAGIGVRHETALTPARSSRRPRPRSIATASATSS